MDYDDGFDRGYAEGLLDGAGMKEALQEYLLAERKKQQNAEFNTMFKMIAEYAKESGNER